MHSEKIPHFQSITPTNKLFNNLCTKLLTSLKIFATINEQQAGFYPHLKQMSKKVMSHSRKGAHESIFMEWHLAAPFFIFGGKSIKGTVRINRKIRVPQVRLVDESGALVGVIDTSAAVQMAEERGYDLVEVAPGANPPVCRLMDFGQYKYELTKKAKEAKKKQKVIKLKEVKVRPKTDEGDLQTKCNAIRKFLDDGDKVKVSVAFRGRERAHMEVGFKVVERMKQILGEDAEIERDACTEGNAITMILFRTAKKK
jgi:translation initiation factor IF-3